MSRYLYTKAKDYTHVKFKNQTLVFQNPFDKWQPLRRVDILSPQIARKYLEFQMYGSLRRGVLSFMVAIVL